MDEKEKDKKDQDKKGPDQKVLKISKDASIDFPVDVIATEADPYHETGAQFQAGKKKAEELVKRGWVRMARAASMIALFIMASFGSYAQTSVLADMYNASNSYSLAELNASTVTSDTVTNTGSGFLYAKRVAGPGTVTVQVNATKVSGTVGGTLTLYGSLDGVTYSALNTEETQTALATKTATDATASYHWRLKNSPFLYYGVGWVGTGTMVATFTAKIMKH